MALPATSFDGFDLPKSPPYEFANLETIRASRRLYLMRLASQRSNARFSDDRESAPLVPA
jgi:hypothetical protein